MWPPKSQADPPQGGEFSALTKQYLAESPSARSCPPKDKLMDIRSETNTTSNRLLNFLSPENRAILAPHLERVSLTVRETLEEPNQPIVHIYFPEDGVASVVGTSNAMGQYEVGIIGKEGMTGLTYAAPELPDL
jgi:hypothetical protein